MKYCGKCGKELTKKRLWLRAFRRWVGYGPEFIEERPIEAQLIEQAVSDYEALESENAELLEALERAEQTLRNLGNGDLTGEARIIALNCAASLATQISIAKEE